MRRKLAVRPQAELDLIKHHVYLAEHQPGSVTRFKQAIRAAFAAIKSDPRSSAILDRTILTDLELRFCKPHGFKNYLVVLQVADDSVVVLRVLHASQDIEAALRP